MINDDNIDTKIFESISGYLVKPDFLGAQNDFYKAHAFQFEDTEENKLEHTNLHKDYIKIFDDKIDRHLQKDFSQEQIESFLKTFNENKDQYREINPNTYLQLFAFVDFTEFKKIVLDYKDLAKFG